MLGLPLREVETQELSAAAASVTFSSIDTKVPSGSRHLVVIVSAASADAVSERTLEMQLNGDTGSNYHFERLTGSGSTAASVRANNDPRIPAGVIPGSSVHASAMGGGEILIPHFANALNHKATISQIGSAENKVSVAIGRWADTSAITSLLLKLSSGNFLAGSRFVLCVVDERYLIAESILSGGDGTFSFATLPAVEGDLAFIGYCRSNLSAGADSFLIEINGDATAANYAFQYVRGVSAVVSAASGTDRNAGIGTANNSGANIFAPFVGVISAFNRGDDDPHCTILSGSPDATGYIQANSVRRNNVAAVTQVDFPTNSGSNFKDGSMMSLYLVPRRLVQRQVLTGIAASVTFDSLPTDVEALELRVYARVDGAVTSDPVDVEFNDDTTAANYDRQLLEGDGSTVTAAQSAAAQTQMEVPGASAGADIWGGGSILIPMHEKTDRHKHLVSLGGPADDVVQLLSTRWENTAKIIKIVLTPNAGSNFIAGSVFELWAVYANGQDVEDRTRTTKTMVAV